MRKLFFLFAFVVLLIFDRQSFAQEKFDETREEMASYLTSIKKAAKESIWDEALTSLKDAKNIWYNQIKVLIVQDQEKGKRFQEYFNRMDEIEANLDNIEKILDEKNLHEIESAINQTIWSISHHPRGFEVPKPKNTVWDWVFALTIGIGYCIGITFFGLYLRKSFYRRYKKYS